MPEMDGYEAARTIREEEGRGARGGRRTPIVALTAHALEGDRELSLAAGMDDHLSKPFRINQLEEVLARWLKAVEKPAPAVAAAPATPAAARRKRTSSTPRRSSPSAPSSGRGFPAWCARPSPSISRTPRR